MISLRSFDEEVFEVDEAVALESETIKHLIEDDCANTSIPLHNITGKILAKVIEYCKRHVEVPKAEDKTAKEDLSTFDAEFVKVEEHTFQSHAEGLSEPASLTLRGIRKDCVHSTLPDTTLWDFTWLPTT